MRPHLLAALALALCACGAQRGATPSGREVRVEAQDLVLDVELEGALQSQVKFLAKQAREFDAEATKLDQAARKAFDRKDQKALTDARSQLIDPCRNAPTHPGACTPAVSTQCAAMSRAVLAVTPRAAIPSPSADRKPSAPVPV